VHLLVNGVSDTGLIRHGLVDVSPEMLLGSAVGIDSF
jgi:hypothetical protein